MTARSDGARPARSPGMPTRARRLALALACVLAPGALAAQARPDSSGFVTTADGARLYYEIQGHGRDTVIVPAGMLLGHYLAPLGDVNTLVLYDPRGRGRSDWIPENKRLSIDHELRDLDAVRTSLGISRVALIGFSYLGLVTALYAADHPAAVTRVALLGPVAPDAQTGSRYAPPERAIRTDSAAARFARLRAGADTTDAAGECRRWYGTYGQLLVGDTAVAGELVTDFCASENESPARFLWRNDQVMRSLPRRWDFTRKAAAIRAPTLVIQGDRDLTVSPDGARRWTELVPDARLIMLAGAGHLTFLERGNRVLPALSRFLAGSWPPEAMQLRTR